ncbi:2-oxo-4-hydroxy-4-carboxy-5-ureidoimidazoline decarboxylase [Natribacillus halophilus]|uniref:2-oxo-4-hydroxy-4-carboxy-5-ureidoimidazoline decarboxylase n=1 Tax=Natribacillus halophilus TaxID=549003 RepID=A0A1G8LYQ9_9BACI|nr:2-oxo-4-hydroxy-4-carboxy-5-ureidoimidazoline decarboxylase [Natribacillus halophilus]SDI60872.1 2-oxo-4-hydroxy-4-carboxy-5-ureidoimidazoline decarboxylase [Natribacillus halophilus]
MTKQTLKDINEMSRKNFIGILGKIYEHSPWVAERSLNSRPFASLDDLHETMKQTVQLANKEEKLALLRAHPDLAGRVELTTSSQKEQSGADLDQLSQEEYENFLALNRRYTEKFDFPFIMAVKGHSKDSIYHSMMERVENDYDREYETALNEIYKIARFRLEDAIKS